MLIKQVVRVFSKSVEVDNAKKNISMVQFRFSISISIPRHLIKNGRGNLEVCIENPKWKTIKLAIT